MNRLLDSIKLLALAGGFHFFSSCSYEPEEPAFGFYPSRNFPPVEYSSPRNPITREGFELGRDLFYENGLSLDSSINCSSCHAQTHAFADHNVPLSAGVGGKLGKRNSPALINLAWMPQFMADGGIVHLDVMPLAPITDTLEMALPMQMAIDRLKCDSEYRSKFEKAFGTDTITSQRIFFAMSQFMLLMVSDDSRFDKYLEGEALLSDSERRGYSLFNTHCANCHTEPLFTDYSYERNGIDSEFDDLGRGRITLDPADDGKFKVPTLRNVELTYPYMHDGRFFTLEEVLDHYSDEVEPNMSHRLPQPLNLTSAEKEDIIQFLKTLTDYSFISDPKLAEPRR
ncbi:cytochrome-c peroxidase [Phaeocystidibacter luteus]|uniref:C-type cytochrome n=1 Tax=Phaeocystidibacter luteus TaxID=911197 RepID=A0A6N6RJ95_9FLAO|nr:cytochrome c peroxidase [Phaeocystidibacter luteus]KAB2814066.1 c-type cytochrome [Phaeocystidibacter luteus]